MDRIPVSAIRKSAADRTGEQKNGNDRILLYPLLPEGSKVEPQGYRDQTSRLWILYMIYERSFRAGKTMNTWTRIIVVSILLLMLLEPAVNATGSAQENITSGISEYVPLGMVSGVPLFPPDHIWNTRIDSLPVDPNSAEYIVTIGSSNYLHADFGSGVYEGYPMGIPYNLVNGSQEKKTVAFEYADESDPGPYPIPDNPLVEGGSDHHILIIDRDARILYELFAAEKQVDGSWSAGSGAVFNVSDYALRPSGWTSADAAGLAILPGLVRYDEVSAGEINHALRFTVPSTRRAYVWPARHYASSITDQAYPPMGQRFRLKSSFNSSGYPYQAKIVLEALKKYGMILSDNGAPWYITGVPDEHWDNDALHTLHQLKGSDFEAVDCSSLIIDPDSGQARTPPVSTSFPDEIGVYRDGVWYLDNDGSGTWNTGDKAYSFGAPGWTPITGDWNASGKTSVGVTNGQQWYLDNDGSGTWNTGDKAYSFGAPGWTPITGDWNASGKTSVGVTNGQQWYLDNDGSGTWNTGDKAYSFGAPGWTPITGDWNASGKTSVGVTNGQQWYLDWNGNGAWDSGIDKVYTFGITGWIPVLRDWNGDTRTEIGLYKGGVWYLDFNGNGTWDAGVDRMYIFGADGWTPMAGDWNGGGTFRIGVTNGLQWYLDADGNGAWNTGTDYANTFGVTGWIPVIGKWN